MIKLTTIQTAWAVTLEQARVHLRVSSAWSDEISSGSLTVGEYYIITARDDAVFTADGAANNNVGTEFTATGTSVTLDSGDKVKVKQNATEDSYITGLIKAAQEACENFTGRKFNDGKYDYYLDKFPNGADLAGVIYIPYSPVKVYHESYDFIVKYYDTDNAQQTLTQNTDYLPDIISNPPRVVPIDTWIDTYNKINAVTISFQTGYTSPDFIPVAVQEAMYLLIGDMWLYREDQVRRFPTAAQRLLMPLRVWV